MAEKQLIDRFSYGKIASAIDMPNLLDIQIDSYNWFLQKDRTPGERTKQGLQAVFNSIFSNCGRPQSVFTGIRGL